MRNRPAFLLLSIFALSLQINNVSAAIRYVKPLAVGLADGSSWDDASADLQAMINASVAGDEVWVAAGVYYPDAGATYADNDRNATFRPKNGVTIYGSLAGSEPSGYNMTLRNLVANASVLHGDLMQNDLPGFMNIGDNAIHVVTGSAFNATAVIDGFTITAGNGSQGGGLYNSSGSPTLRQCRFVTNHAGLGGAICNILFSSPVLTNCAFLGNQATTNGGGVYNSFGSTPRMTNCLFSGNYAATNGGGLYNGSGSTAVVTNNSFSGNRAGTNGGAIFNETSSPTISNTLIWNNQAGASTVSTSASIFNNTSSPSFAYSIIANSGGSGAWVAAIGVNNGNNLDANPLFTDAIDPALAPTVSGDLTVDLCSPAIAMGNNNADLDGAGPGIATISDVQTDLAGNARIFNAIVDIGAYEVQTVWPEAICVSDITIELDITNIATVNAEDVDNGSIGCGALSYLVNGQSSLTFDCDDLNIPHLVTLQVTDALNNVDECQANIIVEDPVGPVAICVDTLVVQLGPSCQRTFSVDDFDVGSYDNCEIESREVSQLNFDCSDAGDNPVYLTITDVQGLTSTCTTIVRILLPVIPMITCPGDISVSNDAGQCGAVVDYIVTCEDCTLGLVQTAGLASGQSFPIGTTTHTWVATSVSGNTVECSFTVTVSDTTICGCGNPEPGTACDDGVACTLNDMINANCECEGTPIVCDDLDPCTMDVCEEGLCTFIELPDSDSDGTCDAEDGCPSDPNKLAPGNCGCGNLEPLTACDDGDLCTTDDMILVNCECAGMPIICDDMDPCTMDVCEAGACTFVELPDSDNDGTCDGLDGCPNDPNKLEPGMCGCGNPEPGTACDDGDACTLNDMINASCDCEGTPIVCDDMDPCTMDVCEAGVCTFVELPNSDNDGTCDEQDGCPNDPNKLEPGMCGCGNPEPGTACDDGDACTLNDMINMNCDCEGIPIVCDDMDPCTMDVCEAGVCTFVELPDSDNDGTCDEQDGCPNDPNKLEPGMCGCGNPEPGTACDDGDACTLNDMINMNCDCEGTPIVCDDMDPCTMDVCEAGVCTFVELPDSDNDGTCDGLDGCPNDPNKNEPGICGCGNPEPGTACDDGDACTYDDVITANCECAGTPLNCDDMDPCTMDICDDRSCTYVELPDSDGDGACDAIDGCPNDPNKTAPGICGCGNPEPGTACDDGNINTIDDVITSNCICAGDPVGGNPPEAVCGVITVYVNPSSPVYDGPGSNNIWWIPADDLDAGSLSDSPTPEVQVKRLLSNIAFEWTTLGACIDVTPNGTYQNQDKGIVYRDCLPVANTDFNKSRLYKLQITDEFGSNECSGVVRVVPLAAGISGVPTIHYVILDDEIAIDTLGEDGKTSDVTDSQTDADAITEFKVLPNPGTELLQVEWESAEDKEVMVIITNSTGSRVTSQQLMSLTGSNRVGFDMSAWGPGVYIVSLKSGDTVENARWLKVGG